MDKPSPSGLRTLFLVHCIVGIVVGLIYLLIPGRWGVLIGWPYRDPVLHRLLGAAILGFATSSWLAYRDTVWERVKIVVRMEIVWTAIGTLVMLWGLLFAGVPAFGWVYAVILAGFAVAFSLLYQRA